jgi:hypothetical protein
MAEVVECRSTNRLMGVSRAVFSRRLLSVFPHRFFETLGLVFLVALYF